MAEPLRHRQTKEAATDMFYLKPPRHISTLPKTEVPGFARHVRFTLTSRHRQPAPAWRFGANRFTSHCGKPFCPLAMRYTLINTRRHFNVRFCVEHGKLALACHCLIGGKGKNENRSNCSLNGKRSAQALRWHRARRISFDRRAG